MDVLTPLTEHGWLAQFLGPWEADGDWNGTETISQIGGFWIVGHGMSTREDGTLEETQVTLGFDAERGKFVGTWVGSMSSHHWVYEGELDEDGQKLTLECDGPSFSDPLVTCRYRDTWEVVDSKTRLLRCEVRGESGEWEQFMLSRYRRADLG